MRGVNVVERLRAAGCVFAEDEARLLLAAGGDTEALLGRRIAGEPLEHVLGWAELSGVRVHVDTGVFVPRRRSELLVRETAARAKPGDVVVDVCCGTGAVGLAVARAVPGIELHSCDLDPAAVACARRNVPRAHLGDLLDAVPAALRIDLVVANAPYVPTGELPFLPAEAREHEATVALDGGADGLDVQRRLIRQIAERSVPILVVETSERQAATTETIARAAGLDALQIADDELDATVVVCRRV
jgi:release factor glutamine methyltransferase